MTSATPNQRKIRLVCLAHVYYTHEDASKAAQFLDDFGFEKTKQIGKDTYYHGTGSQPWLYCLQEGSEDEFGGAAFVVETKEDLDYASETLPGASSIYELDQAPGGGLCVTFKDPVDQFPFHLVYGQGPKEDTTVLPSLKYNLPTQKPRTGNTTQRFKQGPAPVHKLGHFGMCVTNFAKAYEFYTSRFNFKPSDLIHDGNGKNVTTFMHLDRGQELVDHHCFFMFEGPEWHVHHSSFETHDFDTQLLGHHWLRQKGYQNCWGVGRHIMGSQIFDYWFDPSRFILEHYVDGDLVDESNPTNHSLASLNNLHVWGPDLPEGFLG